jgi:hypothetical protein
MDKMAFDLRKIPCVQNGVAETLSHLGDGAAPASGSQRRRPSPRQAPRSCWRTITRTLLSEFLDDFLKGDHGRVLHG